MASITESPGLEELLTPLLASLPAAAVCSKPPSALLPILSPILRQRVQILSQSSEEPWLSLLCYDDSIVSKLEMVSSSLQLELHPVSGQVEIDWESDSDIQFRRIDTETLNALISISRLNLTVKLLWCTNDTAGINGCDGWRIGEIGICNADDVAWGAKSIPRAEEEFLTNCTQKLQSCNHTNGTQSSAKSEIEEEKEEDDDKYWAQYDNVSAQSPALKKDQFQPIPTNKVNDVRGNEEEYYASYDMVQPALDNDDPDEAVDYSVLRNRVSECRATKSPLNIDRSFSSLQQNGSEAWVDRSDESSKFTTKNPISYLHAESNMSSSGSNSVAKTDRQIVSSVASEKAIKTHISASLKSLHRLSRAAGIEQEEFDRIVRTQLDLMSITSEEQDDF